MSKAEFDNYSSNYEEALNRGIGVSGEDSSYFAEGRLRWLAKQLRLRDFKANSVIDFGCGVGNSLPYLHELIGAQRIAGIDISTESISMARQRFANDHFELGTLDEIPVEANFDLAFCNGVFPSYSVSGASQQRSPRLPTFAPGRTVCILRKQSAQPGHSICDESHSL